MRIRFIIIFMLFFSLGLFGFLLHKKVLILEFAWPCSAKHELVVQNEEQKKVSLFYPQEDGFAQETVTLLWNASHRCASSKIMVQQWLALLSAEHVLEQPVGVQTVLSNQMETEVYISFDRVFLKKAWSIQKKWHVIESLLKTIRTAIPELQSVYFLVNHQPMQDAHLDFSYAWPMRGFLQ